MHIAFFNNQETFLYVSTLAPDADPEEGAAATAQALGLPQGDYSWRVVTGEEAEALQAPSQADIQAALQARFTGAIQEHLDGFARTRGYDNIHTACTYAGDMDPDFNREGSYAKAARSATWRAAYGILGAVLAGAREMPTLEEVLAELPVLEWPDAVREEAKEQGEQGEETEQQETTEGEEGKEEEQEEEKAEEEEEKEGEA